MITKACYDGVIQYTKFMIIYLTRDQMKTELVQTSIYMYKDLFSHSFLKCIVCMQQWKILLYQVFHILVNVEINFFFEMVQSDQRII